MIALEKAALEGVLGESVDEFGASLWVLRGFASESFAFDWSREIQELTEQGKTVHVAYYGDADPSGVEIEQDAKDKLRRHGAEFEWTRAGLLFEDFERFDLTRIPVKRSDSRSARYLETFGDVAAELDALPPRELQRRVRECIEAHTRHEEWERMRVVEREEKRTLDAVTRNWTAAVKGAEGAA